MLVTIIADGANSKTIPELPSIPRLDWSQPRPSSASRRPIVSRKGRSSVGLTSPQARGTPKSGSPGSSVGGHGRRVPVHQPRHDLWPHREHRFALSGETVPSQRPAAGQPSHRVIQSRLKDAELVEYGAKLISSGLGEADPPRSTGTVGWSRGTRRGSSSRTGSSFRA